MKLNGFNNGRDTTEGIGGKNHFYKKSPSIEQNFVPYEPAIKLKELGFDEPCFGYYSSLETGTLRISKTVNLNGTNYAGIENCWLAPLYQQAFKFLRDKYNVDAWVQPFVMQKKPGETYLPDESYSFFIYKDGIWIEDQCDFLEPEEAELECLIHAIKIAKIKSK